MNGIAQLNMLPEHLHQALDGYPVEELFQMGLDPSSARHTVRAWLDTLEHDLAVFPPASTDVLVNIKSQMEMAREGLAEVIETCW